MPVALVGWKKRRIDKKTEIFWVERSKKWDLNPFEMYQQEWNFREVEYNGTPSNNGLCLANPGFAYTSDLAKYIVHK